VFSEQVAPFLPDFPEDLKASEARFIGKPVDFLIFDQQAR
jgi:predicted Holliday junction resolvase-like endonuclease